jgi:acyl-CoA thioester hydrolase
MAKTGFMHEIELRTRYGETDQMGFVYYGRFAEYLEVGRVEAIRSLGLSYKVLEDQYQVWMPVMSMQIRYIRPAGYDQLLRIQTTIRDIPEETITFFSEIFNEQNELVCAATIKLCFLNSTDKSRVNCPDFLKERLQYVIETADRR